MAAKFTMSYISNVTERLRYYKRQAERALEQVDDRALFYVPSPGSNSIAVIIKHLSGNMRSRWTCFLTTDGEKPDRDYTAEFSDPPGSRVELVKLWDSGWQCALGTLVTLTDDHLAQTVTIRSEPHSVLQAINRQLAHVSYHVGQIVYLAKWAAGSDWQSLTGPH